MTREEKVRQFLIAAGKAPYNPALPVMDGSMVSGVKEEAFELIDAIWDYHIACEESNPTAMKVTRENLAKELADAQYVISNIAWYFDIPMDAAFNRVHNSNMTKVVDGKITFRHDGKILKPDTYEAPDMKGL